MRKLSALLFLALFGFSQLTSASLPDAQGDALYLLRSGILSRGLAKEVCSCHFIYGLEPKTCAEWKHLPPQVFAFVQVSVDEATKEVRVGPTPNPPVALPFTISSATARFVRQGRYYGCNINWVSP